MVCYKRKEGASSHLPQLLEIKVAVGVVPAASQLLLHRHTLKETQTGHNRFTAMTTPTVRQTGYPPKPLSTSTTNRTSNPLIQ